MRQRIVRCALALCATALAAGCEEPVEVPDAGEADSGWEPGGEDGGTHYGFCPTSIDVFGGSASVLAGCGGQEAEPTAQGLFAPGDAGYELTLAGRLRARLQEDPELVTRFGGSFTVRSCARLGTMGSYLRRVPSAECANGGNTGDAELLCSQSPAPLVLFDATNVHDRCHGGGPDSAFDDDPEGYAEHWRARFEEFHQSRAPAFLMVSPQVDWLPLTSASTGDCSGVRSTWSPLGARRWRALNPEEATVRRLDTLQAEFEQHHPCCADRGVACAENWYAPGTDGADGWSRFDCRGAARVVDHWFAELKRYLLLNHFSCP